MKINHIDKKNVNKEVDYPSIFYMKKWWLEYRFTDKSGRDVQFSGWINTVALRKEDFPDTLEGSFWVEPCSEKECKESGRDTANRGYFDIGFGEKDNYVIGTVYVGNEYTTRKPAQSSTWERFDAKIEDCLNIEYTYITAINTE